MEDDNISDNNKENVNINTNVAVNEIFSITPILKKILKSTLHLSSVGTEDWSDIETETGDSSALLTELDKKISEALKYLSTFENTELTLSEQNERIVQLKEEVAQKRALIKTYKETLFRGEEEADDAQPAYEMETF